MPVRHILVDDTNSLHRELPIYRTGQTGAVRLADSSYKVYRSMEISAHDLAAMFHYGLIEALNTLPFISEANNGLDSWDEAFLPSSHIPALVRILDDFIALLKTKAPEKVMLGWQDDPERIAYWRSIDPEQATTFLLKLKQFALEASSGNFDLEFIL
jgi:hypothetical protein